MGCNSHLFIEVKAEPVNCWWTWAKDVRECRSYITYAALAGVRRGDELSPVVPPRGVPVDCDYDIAEEMKCEDYHTHTWLKPSEFDEAMRRAADYCEAKHLAWEWESVNKTLQMLAGIHGDDRVRIIIAFDN
jgi:hypothetical protein